MSMTVNGAVLVLLALAFSTEAKLVNVTLYSEALCPDCAQFVRTDLSRAVEEIGSIFTFKFVPWGNARQNAFHEFVCQHGPMECTMNTIEACVLYYYPKRDDFFPYLVCLDKHLDNMDPKIAKKCAEENNIVWDKIDSCYQGKLGHELEEMYAAETAELKPRHEYVPWVTINGKHEPEAEGSRLIEVICNAYTGTKPRPCE
jgi:interferon gamma-inducible protein 30